MDLIQIKNVSFNYGDNLILSCVSFSFPEKGLISIIGKSGAGKSTLLSLLNKTLKPTSGEIIYNNDLIINTAFQSPLLLDYLNVYDNVALPLILNGVESDVVKDKVNKVLSEVELLEKINSNIKYLSGGEKQRVAIARAIINDTNVLILDEPTGSLDEKTSINIYSLLSKLSEKMLVVIVTHDEKNALIISDKVYKIENKKIDLIKENNKLSDISNNKVIKKVNKENKIRIKDGIILSYKYFLKYKFRIILCTIFLSFAFAFLSISFNIYRNIDKAIEKDLNNYYSSEIATISKIEEISSSTNIKVEQIRLPNKKDLELLNITKVYPSLDYLIPEYQEVYLNKKYGDVRFLPIINNDVNKLSIGSIPQNYQEIIVNKTFADLFGLNYDEIINKNLYVYHQVLINDEKSNISDLIKIEIEFNIVGISKEAKVFNEACVYYSYFDLYDYIDSIKCENISNYYLQDKTIKNVLDDSLVFNCDLNGRKYIFNSKNILDINNVIKDNGYKYKLSSKIIDIKESTKDLVLSITKIFSLYLGIFLLSSILLMFLSIYSLYDNNIRLFALTKVYSDKKNIIRIVFSSGLIFFILVTITTLAFSLIFKIIFFIVLKYLEMPLVIKFIDFISSFLVIILALIITLLTSFLPLRKIKPSKIKKELEGED